MASVAELFQGRERYEGKVVSLTLNYGKRDETDPAPASMSRSDCFLHDPTGSILVHGGWQIRNEWQMSGRDYRSEALDIGPDGVWHIKKATAYYSSEGYPCLEPVRGTD